MAGGGGQRRIACQQLKGQRLQRVAHENRRRLVKGLVTGRPSPSEVIVIHGRKIVMHQGIHMDELDGACGRLDAVFGQTQGPRGCEQQRRPDALTPAQDAVAHGLVQPGRDAGGGWQACCQRIFHARAPHFELSAEGVMHSRTGLRRGYPIGCVVQSILLSKSGASAARPQCLLPAPAAHAAPARWGWRQPWGNVPSRCRGSADRAPWDPRRAVHESTSIALSTGG